MRYRAARLLDRAQFTLSSQAPSSPGHRVGCIARQLGLHPAALSLKTLVDGASLWRSGVDAAHVTPR